MIYRAIVEDRRVADRISSLIGRRSLYSGLPRREYRIGAYTVRAGWLSVEEAEERVLRKLTAEKLILPPGEDLPAPKAEPLPEPMSVPFPMDGHTARSLCNLVCILCCRGDLLSRATGGAFGADRELAELLRSHGHEPGKKELRSRAEVLRVLREYAAARGRSGLEGVSISETGIVFDGFRRVPDEAHRRTFRHLADAVMHMALRQKFIRMEAGGSENERYRMRAWLARTDLGGKAYKADRKRLLAPLSGRSGQKTPPGPESAGPR